MTIPVSSVPAVKTYLFDQLTAQLTGDGTTSFGVFYGPPGENQPGYIVSVGDVTDRSVEPYQMVGDGGTGAFREMFHVAVVINCFHGDLEAGDLEAVTLGYVASIETLVREDMTFGGAVLKAEPAGSTTALTWADDYSGLISTITLQIAVLAII